MKNSGATSDYVQNVLLIKVPVVVELATINVSVSDLLRIAHGTIIPTRQNVSDVVTISAEGIPIAKGTVSANGIGCEIQVTEVLNSKHDTSNKRAA
jgi:flagellar motor switch/type III secretory pathway protein FliN